jgi:hypothetical protein
MATIITPRPPLNLFEVARLNVTSSWQTLYDVPEYQVPANGPNPSKTVDAAAILTNLTVSNAGTTTVDVSVKIIDSANAEFIIANKLPIFAFDFASLGVERQVLKTGDRIQVKVEAGQSAVAMMSFVLNTREEFTEIAP